MDTPRWAQILNIAFPTLSREGFQIVAQPSDNYNCIAYAVGDFHNWWDYGYGVSRYWPPHAARSSAIENLVEIFAGLGFERCADDSAEDGIQKIALYANTPATGRTPPSSSPTDAGAAKWAAAH